MPRIRTVKPEFWTDTKVIGLSIEARLLFLGSWNFADDYGCVAPDAMQLKLRVLPTSTADACELVDEIFAAGLFERLRGRGGREFWHVTNWSKHQRVNRPTESEYGLPTEWKPAVTGGFSEDSRRTHGAVSESSVSTHGGMEGKGTERKGSATHREGKSEGEGARAKPILPAQRALDLWEAVTGNRLTRSERASDGLKAGEFLTATGLNPDDEQMRLFLEWAHNEDNTWAVGGWPKAWAKYRSRQGAQLTDEQIEANYLAELADLRAKGLEP